MEKTNMALTGETFAISSAIGFWLSALLITHSIYNVQYGLFIILPLFSLIICFLSYLSYKNNKHSIEKLSLLFTGYFFAFYTIGITKTGVPKVINNITVKVFVDNDLFYYLTFIAIFVSVYLFSIFLSQIFYKITFRKWYEGKKNSNNEVQWKDIKSIFDGIYKDKRIKFDILNGFVERCYLTLFVFLCFILYLSISVNQLILNIDIGKDYNDKAIYAGVLSVLGFLIPLYLKVKHVLMGARHNSRAKWVNDIKESLTIIIDGMNRQRGAELFHNEIPVQGEKSYLTSSGIEWDEELKTEGEVLFASNVTQQRMKINQARLKLEVYLNPEEVPNQALLALIRIAYGVYLPYLDKEPLIELGIINKSNADLWDSGEEPRLNMHICSADALSKLRTYNWLPEAKISQYEEGHYKLVSMIILLSNLIAKREWEKAKSGR